METGRQIDYFVGKDGKKHYINQGEVPSHSHAIADVTGLQAALAGKMENIVFGNEPIAFDVVNNALALKSDTSIYAPLFRDYSSNFPVEISVYDENEDENVPFIGFCSSGGDTTTRYARVYIGERVLVLQKDVATGVVTIYSTYTLGSLLS